MAPAVTSDLRSRILIRAGGLLAAATAAAAIVAPAAGADCTKPVTDPANPLRVEYVCAGEEATGEPSFALPTGPGFRVIQSREDPVDPAALAESKGAIPLGAFLEGGDAPGFELTALDAVVWGDGTFSVGAYYRESGSRRTITLGSWTKSGEFLVIGYADSPTQATRQTTILGLPALTTFPTAAMAGGVGTRTVLFTTGDRIYAITAENFDSDQPILALAQTLAVRHGGVKPPASGSGYAPATPAEWRWALIFGAVATVATLAASRSPRS